MLRKKFTLFLSGLLLFSTVYATLAQQHATLYRRNGDRYTGYWRGSNEQFHQITLLDGQKLRIPVSETLYILFTFNLNNSPNVEAQKHFTNGEQMLELGMVEFAKEAFLVAIKEFPKYADAHYKLGLILEKEGKAEEAMEYFARVVKIAPDRYDMAGKFKKAGDDYLAEDEYGRAADAYYQHFNSFPNDQFAEEAIYQAGFLFAEQLQDQNKAVIALENALESFPNSPYAEKAHFMLGKTYQLKGENLMAIQKLTDFISNPFYINSQWLDDAHLARGKAYLQGQMNGEAISDFCHVKNISDTLVGEAQTMINESVWHVYTVADGLPTNNIQALAADGDVLWVGTPEGLVKFDINNGAFVPLPDELRMEPQPNVKALAVNEQELWIGTLNNGIIKYDKVLDTMMPYRRHNGLPDNRIFDIELFGNEVWVGTFNGVGYFDGDKWTQYSESDGLPANDVVVLAVTQNYVWVGTSRNGIGVYDKINNRWTEITKMELPANVGNSISSIVPGENTVWFGWKSEFKTGYCVYNMLKDEWKSSTVEDQTTPVENIYLELGEDELWICVLNGIYRAIGIWDALTSGRNWDTFTYPKKFGKDMKVECIELSGGEAWVGTTEGLGRVDGSILVRR